MKKSSKILLLIGGFLGIFLTLLWFSLTIVLFVGGGLMTAWISGVDIGNAARDWLQALAKSTGYNQSIYYSMEAFENHCYNQAACWLVMFFFAVPSTVISFILHKKEKTGLPLPIVLAVISTPCINIAAIVGAGLAIANWAVVERKEGQQPAEEKR